MRNEATDERWTNVGIRATRAIRNLTRVLRHQLASGERETNAVETKGNALNHKVRAAKATG